MGTEESNQEPNRATPEANKSEPSTDDKPQITTESEPNQPASIVPNQPTPDKTGDGLRDSPPLIPTEIKNPTSDALAMVQAQLPKVIERLGQAAVKGNKEAMRHFVRMASKLVEGSFDVSGAKKLRPSEDIDGYAEPIQENGAQVQIVERVAPIPPGHILVEANPDDPDSQHLDQETLRLLYDLDMGLSETVWRYESGLPCSDLETMIAQSVLASKLLAARPLDENAKAWKARTDEARRVALPLIRAILEGNGQNVQNSTAQDAPQSTQAART